ncbi:MAG TPA: O-antigen ligase family protein [Candidatus Acidoferrum sp.]|nr:O-antigen ligase family protein [Candidatus Acidoferrum sp.]
MKAIEIALIAGTIVAVGAFGGTEPVSFAVVEILFFAVAAWAVIRPKRIPVSVQLRQFAVPAALTAVVLLQLIPFPASLVPGWLRGQSYSGSRFVTLSVAPYSSRSDFLILLACLIALFFAYAVGQDRDRKRRLILALMALGTAEAFYGLIQYLMNWQRIFWYAKKYDLEEATGTYINRNHFAGFLEMILPFAIAFALYEGEKLAAARGQHAGETRRWAARPNAAKVVLWLAVAMVVMAAIVFSRSRMGMVAACASLAVVFGLKATEKRRAAAVLGAAFVVLSICFAAWIGVRPALDRFANMRGEFSGDESRLSMWPGTLRLIGEHPIIGTGLGTFPVVYTTVQTTFLTQFVNHAHNDYLEISSDIGIPAATLLFGSIFFVLARAVRNFLHGEGKYGRAVSLACAGSIVAMLLHSATDFNLHIPANALLFALILGLAMASTQKAASVELAS